MLTYWHSELEMCPCIYSNLEFEKIKSWCSWPIIGALVVYHNAKLFYLSYFFIWSSAEESWPLQNSVREAIKTAKPEHFLASDEFRGQYWGCHWGWSSEFSQKTLTKPKRPFLTSTEAMAPAVCSRLRPNFGILKIALDLAAVDQFELFQSFLSIFLKGLSLKI